MSNLSEKARQILRDNDQGSYTVPTTGLYPYQWNWDSAFVALGFATFDVDRAFTEIESLFEGQWPNGMLPHILFRVDEPSYFPGPDVWSADQGPIASSGISQPPVAATVVRELARHNPDRASHLLPAIERWHLWWHKARDPLELGVIAITHPWESGRDNLPDWDAPGDNIDTSGVGDYQRRDTSVVDNDMRPKKKDYDRYLALVKHGRDRQWDAERIVSDSPFLVGDPAISAILLRAERDLMALKMKFGESCSAIEKRIDRLEKGFERFWNPAINAYASLDLREGTLAPFATSASLLALYAGVDKRQTECIQLLQHLDKHCKYLVPSFDPAHELFDHIRYWRGPIWAIINFMILKGLQDFGETEWANRIQQDTLTLIEQSGFSEYFSPLDAQGCGGGTFSWTAAIYLALTNNH